MLNAECSYTISLMLEPSTPVQYVKGVGPKLAEILAGKGLHTVDDLCIIFLFATRTGSTQGA